MNLTLYTDGGARGNPGPGGAGIVLKDEGGNTIKEIGKYLGNCTNNEAEYLALIMGLKVAKEAGAKRVTCYLDSELIVKQLNGLYKVKNERMRIYYDKVLEFEEDFMDIDYKHIPRDENNEADTLVNEALDRKIHGVRLDSVSLTP